MAKITVAQIQEIATELQWVTLLGIAVEEIGEGGARLRLPASESVLRPGGPLVHRPNRMWTLPPRRDKA